MSSPDRLDLGARLVSPASRLLLTVLLLIVLTCLIGSLVIRVPIKVAAQGMLMSPLGVKEVVSTTSGRVHGIRVRVGERVAAGQPLADIEQPDLQQDIALAKAELRDSEEQLQRVRSFQARSMAEAGDLRSGLRKELQSKLATTQQRQVLLKQQADAVDKLVGLGIAAKPQALAAGVALAGADEDIARGRNAVKQLEREAQQEKTAHEREALELEFKQAAAQRKLAMLNARLERLDVLASPYSGTVSELKLNDGEMIERGAPLLSVLPDAPAGAASPSIGVKGAGRPVGDGTSPAAAHPTPAAAPLVATLYVSAADGKRIRPGMLAELVPATVKREEFGFVFARVLSVAALPSTHEGMQRTLKNQQLVQTLASGGAPFEVQVALDADAATPTGLRWSSSHGPADALSAGSLCAAQVVTREETVFRLLVPALRRFFSRYTE